MDERQLKICNDLIKKNKIGMIDLKCIDLTGYLHHISLPVYPNIISKLVSEGVGFDGSSYGFRKVGEGITTIEEVLTRTDAEPVEANP